VLLEETRQAGVELATVITVLCSLLAISSVIAIERLHHDNSGHVLTHVIAPNRSTALSRLITARSLASIGDENAGRASRPLEQGAA